MERKLENFGERAGRKFCPCCSILIQNFDASLAVKMMVICCILYVECALQKSFDLVTQTRVFEKERNLE